MGIAYDFRNNLALEVWDGTVTLDEWLDLVRKQVDDPEWPARRGMGLTDLRYGLPDPAIGGAEIRQVAALYGAHREKIVRARVALVSGEAFRKSRLFGHFMANYGLTVIVFDDLDTACRWLGVDAGEVQHSIEGLRAGLRGAPQETA